MTRIRSLPLLAAAALVAALGPSAVRAQDEDSPPPTTVRTYDVAGVATPPVSGLRRVGRTSPWPFEWIHPDRAYGAEVEEDAEPAPSTEGIAEIVRTTLPPEIAENTAVGIEARALRLRTTEAGHRRVAAVLDALRRSVGVPFEIELRSVRLPAGAASDSLLAQVAAADPNDLPAELAGRLVAMDADGGAYGGTVRAPAGRWAPLEQVRTHDVVADWDVEIAQAASISDPVRQNVEDGLRAAVRAAHLHDGRALVTFTAAAGDVVEPFRRLEMRTKDLGSAELPEVRGGWSTATAALRRGATAAVVLASPVSGEAAVRRVVLLRLVAAPPAPDIGAGAFLPVAAFEEREFELLLSVPGGERLVGDEEHRWGLELRTRPATGGPGARAEELSEEVDDAVTDDEALEGKYSVALVDDWPGRGALFVQGPARLVDAARRIVADAEADCVRPAWVRVRLARRTADGQETALGALSAPTLLGSDVSLAAYTAVPYVADYDVEVAQEARIADPIVTTAVGGSVLNVRLVEGAGGALRADLELTVTALGAPEVSPVSGAEVGAIERVRTRRARVVESVVVPRGEEREIELGPCAFGGGRLVAFVSAGLAAER